MNVHLSIDFDYFCYEDPAWDWGHQESPMFKTEIWAARYSTSHFDLTEEVTINKADFPPKFLPKLLQEKGLQFGKECIFTIADSHRLAKTALTPKADALLSFDAHIDYYPIQEYGDCSNWMRSVEKQYKHITNIIPKWSEEKDYLHRPRQGKMFYWADLPQQEGEITRIFIAKSSAWTPPHMDRYFDELLVAFSEALPKSRSIEWHNDTANRWTPAMQKAAKDREQFLAKLSQMVK